MFGKGFQDILVFLYTGTGQVIAGKEGADILAIAV
jgi:hypothetical protein